MNNAMIIGLLVLIAGCGASFDNVKATAKLGSAIDDKSIVVSDWIADCEATHAAVSDMNIDKICLSPDHKYQSMVETVHEVSGLLATYADSLAQAADAKDLAVGDDLTSLLKQIGTLDVDSIKTSLPSIYNLADVVAQDRALAGKLTATGVVKIVDTLVRFASQGFRRKEIRDAVIAADPHVMVLTAFVSAELELHIKDLEEVRKALDAEIDTKPGGSQSMGLVIGQLLPYMTSPLDTRIATLKRLDAACKAFGKAHHDLATQMLAGKPWENAELMGTLKTDVTSIVKAMNG